MQTTNNATVQKQTNEKRRERKQAPILYKHLNKQIRHFTSESRCFVLGYN